MTTEQTLRETFIEVAARTIEPRLPPTHHASTVMLARDYAIQLYGAVTALNGPLEGIVRSVEEHARQGVRVACVRCGRMKKPHGRSAALEQANSLCDAESCDGYASEPHVGTLWPGESCRDFGYAHSHDGTELTFDPAALFRAIAVESLGGAKASEEFGSLVVGVTEHKAACGLKNRQIEGWQSCPCGAVYGSLLEVPRLTIEGAQS